MVMGWFVALLLGEQAVSHATSARRAAEDAAQQTASATSSAYCSDRLASIGVARTSTSIVPNGKPDVEGAIGMVTALGVGGGIRTFGYYVRPILNARVTASSPAQGRVFVAERSLGCIERPLDTPRGSVAVYRAPIWIQNMMGY